MPDQMRRRRGLMPPLTVLAVLAVAALFLPPDLRALALLVLGLASIPAALVTLRRRVEALTVPPLAPPPSALERRTLGWLRLLVTASAAVSGPLLGGLAWALPDPELAVGDAELLVLVAVVVGGTLVLPIPVLWRRLRILREARSEGLLPVAAARVSATGDHHLDAVLGRQPRATKALCIVIAATSALAWAYPPLEALLAKENGPILSGEVWRLLTVMLVHGGLVHLAMNESALWSVGAGAELLLGHWRMLLVMLLGTVAASAASVVYTPAPAVGASGGIAALLGALLAFGWRQKALLPHGVRDRLVRGGATAAIMTAALGIAIPHIDNAAHGGGFAFGLLCGALFQPSEALRAALVEARARAGEGAPGEPPPPTPSQPR